MNKIYKCGGLVIISTLLLIGCGGSSNDSSGSGSGSGSGGGGVAQSCSSLDFTALTSTYVSTSGLTFINKDEGWLTAMDPTKPANTQLLHTTDAGASWTEISELPSFMLRGSIRFINSDIGYYIGPQGLYQTLDGGATWALLINAAYAYDFNSINTVVLYRDNGFKLKNISNTTNLVTSTTPLPEDLYQVVAMNLSESGVVNFGSVKRLRSNNNGNKTYYDNLYLAQLSNNVISYTKELPIESEQMWANSRSISFVDDSIGYYINPANSGGNFKGGLYKTVDGGSSWTLVKDFNDTNNTVFMTYLSFVDENIGYASSLAAFSTLYKTIDGGMSWSKVYNRDQLVITPEALAIPDATHIYFPTTAHGCDYQNNGPIFIKETIN